MRTLFIAAATAVGFGLAAIQGASAAPVNGAVIGDLATSTNPATTVQYHYRYGSYGHYHNRYRSHGWHWRYGSRGY
jgi:hypothetical protein